MTEYLPLEAIVLLGAISEPDTAIRQRPILAWEIDQQTGKPVGRWIMGARSAASITAKPATGKANDMNGLFTV